MTSTWTVSGDRTFSATSIPTSTTVRVNNAPSAGSNALPSTNPNGQKRSFEVHSVDPNADLNSHLNRAPKRARPVTARKGPGVQQPDSTNLPAGLRTVMLVLSIAISINLCTSVTDNQDNQPGMFQGETITQADIFSPNNLHPRGLYFHIFYMTMA